MQGFCDTLLANMGIAELGINCSLHVVQSEEINAYTVLTENGFAMCLTSSLLTQRGISYNILMGYIAHEFAHGALMHHIRRFYANAKEYRKQRLLGNIAIAVNAAAAGADDGELDCLEYEVGEVVGGILEAGRIISAVTGESFRTFPALNAFIR